MLKTFHAFGYAYNNIELLIEAGADLNIKDLKGNTALIYGRRIE